MVEEVLFNLSLVIGVAAILTLVMRLIRQPPIIAYLIAGIIVGPLVFGLIGTTGESSLIQIFSHIGVAFLLFIVGLSLDFRLLKEFGAVSTVVGLVEIIAVGGIGFLIALWLGFTNVAALYIAAAVAFSSTVVVVKILSDKKEIDTLHGRLALGILIVQDFVAALALMAIPIIDHKGSIVDMLDKLGLAFLLIAGVFLIAAFVFNRMMDYLARNQETLFLFGVAWALFLATIFDSLGFSLEIGALIAGMSLASSKYTLDLGGKMKPLRDFFVVLFFVFFGSQLAGDITLSLVYKALILSVFVMIGKPLLVMLVLRVFGYHKRTNFLAGLSLAQISEFSLILSLLGFTVGHLTQEVMSLSVLTAIITIGASSYMLYYSHSIFDLISRALFFIEGKKYRNEVKGKQEYDVVVFGYHRMGYRVVESLKKAKARFMVVDYNPRVVIALNKQKIECVYGDASDKEFLRELGMEKVKLVVSTIPDPKSNMAIAELLKEVNSKAALVSTAEQARDALNLYEKGSDYVLIPYHLGGYYASHVIENYGINRDKYKELGRKHRKTLEDGKNNSNYAA